MSRGAPSFTLAPPPRVSQSALSSSNPAAGQVPSRVIVPAGTTSATFTVTTSAVTASTSVTISASFGGTVKTASLTVTPPPLPTVTSLTLNPSSVIGGSQSSTGAVTLSGAAPSGGAQVALSSCNTGAAQVPSTVT